MKTIMVRYKTVEGQAAPNEAMVHAVFDELRARAPAGLRYATYLLADGATFLHVASMERADQNSLTTLSSFAAFQKDITARCAEPPAVTELFAVDSYGIVGA